MAGNKNSGFASHPENINMEGRPKKGEALTNILKDAGALEDVDYGGGRIARNKALAQKLWQMALEGDLGAMKYIFDRIDGRPKETVEQTINELPKYIGFYVPDEGDTEDTDIN